MLKLLIDLLILIQLKYIKERGGIGNVSENCRILSNI